MGPTDQDWVEVLWLPVLVEGSVFEFSEHFLLGFRVLDADLVIRSHLHLGVYLSLGLEYAGESVIITANPDRSVVSSQTLYRRHHGGVALDAPISK